MTKNPEILKPGTHIGRITAILVLAIFLMLAGPASAQSGIAVRGVVSDTENKPVIGASVIIKGTTTGTVTNNEGRFSITVGSTDDILEISFIGLTTQEVKATTGREMQIVLEDESKYLDEVVVIGYGSRRKANLTGAVTSVGIDDVEGRALTDVGQVLQGKIPGVNIVQNSGQPGDNSSTIRIRGISSIDNNNDPLVIIDGVEGSFSDVNPNNIESISVLRDASSAAIYGSRASAGVVLIQTKSGGKGLSISYNGNVSMQNATRLPETVNSWEYAALKNEARTNAGTGAPYTEDQIKLFRYGIDPAYPNTDWYDLHFQTAVMHNHHVSASGGNDRFKFVSSISFSDQKGILVGTSSNKLNHSNRLSANFLNNKLRVQMNVSGYKMEMDELISATSTVLAQVAGMTPNTFLRTSDEAGGAYGYNGRFLAARELGGGINRDRDNLVLNGRIEVEPVKNLVASLQMANTRYKEDYVSFSPEFYTAGDIEQNTVNKRESELRKTWMKRENTQMTATLAYNVDIAKHSVGALAGYERLENIYKYDAGLVKELSYNAPIFGFGDPTSHFVSSAAHEFATVSYFGRLSYEYDKRYLLEFNVRRDGSSRFLKGDRWGVFPSVSAGWRVSEEAFFPWKKDVNLKLRGSWGRLGNQNIGSYYAASDKMSGTEYYAFGGTIVPGRGTTLLANQLTTWETTEQMNVGFDAILFNRLEVTFDHFRKNTYDILARVTVPPSLGIAETPYQNIGDMKNTGYELTVGYRSKPRPNNGFRYAVNGNISFLKNRVTNLGGLEFVSHSDDIRSVVGQPFGSFYGYIQDGLWQISDFTWQNDSDPSIPHAERQYVQKDGTVDMSDIMSNIGPGDIKLRDLTGEGKITPDDKTIIGKSIPNVLYGLNVSLSYKNFGLNILGQGVAGSKSMIAGDLVTPFYNTQGTILRQSADKRWTYENQNNRTPRVNEDKSRDAIRSTFNLYNSSYFRLKSVELSYTVPKTFTDKMKIARMRVYVSGENLLLVTKYLKGFDPERDYMRTTAGYHPQVATYTFGINLTL